ncbi:hypothetical protein C8034_v007862 [Colletotrichum sidae]|uniref:Uncharacterized protein n=1 Tax=Colletotrichum sidae TaxID=1347389 RepID=A0A4R8TND5_9PEZI|nr:hypothetical protein C8034_v007862 [Colletotrichum sidae]
MSPEASSNIRVFIRWHDQTVFAGEEIKCTITFKNITRDPNQQRQSQRLAPTDRPRHVSPLLRAKSNSGLTPPNTAQTRNHRSALSLNVPAAQSRSRSGSVPWHSQLNSTAGDHRGNGHKNRIDLVAAMRELPVFKLSLAELLWVYQGLILLALVQLYIGLRHASSPIAVIDNAEHAE